LIFHNNTLKSALGGHNQSIKSEIYCRNEIRAPTSSTASKARKLPLKANVVY